MSEGQVQPGKATRAVLASVCPDDVARTGKYTNYSRVVFDAILASLRIGI